MGYQPSLALATQFLFFLNIACFKSVHASALRGYLLLSTPFNNTTSDVFLITIAGSTGKIFLPHIEKESQQLIAHFFNGSGVRHFIYLKVIGA
jgi:hypothetical protein